MTKAKIREQLLSGRRQNFEVSIRPLNEHEFPLVKGHACLSVTQNGDQWTSINLLPEEMPAVVAALKDYEVNGERVVQDWSADAAVQSLELAVKDLIAVVNAHNRRAKRLKQAKLAEAEIVNVKFALRNLKANV